MRSIFLFILMNLTLITAAQEYRQQIGLRGGFTSGVSYKLFKNELKALEGILSYRDHGIQLTAIIETYKPVYLKHTDKVYFFSGMGAHAGYTLGYADIWPDYHLFRSNYHGNSFRPVVGLDAMLGFEYRFGQMPLILAVDYKPYFELFGHNFFSLNLWDIGISIKYSFIN